MQLTVKNLGYIEEASVDLSKELIVLTGQNNTGKTWLAYTIYSLYDNKPIFAFPIELIDAYWKKDDISKKLHEYLKENKKEIETWFSKDLIDNISQYFSVKNEVVFKKTVFDLQFNQNADFEINKFFNAFNSNFHIGTANRILNSILYHNLYPKVFIFPAERAAVNIFSKELSLSKSQLISKISNGGNGIIDLIQSRVNRYPKPIRDSLEIAEDLQNLSKNNSDFAPLAAQLEYELLKGKIVLSQYGQLEYIPENTDDLSLEIHLTASLVKSFASIVFYLRHLAQKGDCIIIDEPELNLHPDNQRKIARFLGRLINEGFQVIISTHSDYIIKELNTMIMLSKAKELNPTLIEKFGFQSNELINPKQVEALFFSSKNRKVTNIKVSDDGFNVDSIDETMEEQDHLAEEIYWELFQKV